SFQSDRDPRNLHSFPTRRSSDLHGGSEIFHSHHPHGGTIRWLRSPRSSDEMPLWFTAKNGPVKYPVVRTKSDRVDVQVIGPSEADRKSTRLNSSHVSISYAVFCL